MCEWESKTWRVKYRCKVPADLGSSYCIFHKPEEKDPQKFNKKCYEQIDEVGPEDERNPPHDFTGYVFPEGLTVGKIEHRATTHSVVLPKEIPPGARFDEAVVGGIVDFENAIFKGVGAFLGATFKLEALFKRTTFEMDAIFQATTFNSTAVFRDAIFKESVDFSGATFKDAIGFKGSQAATVELGVHRPTILWWEKDREGVTVRHWSSAPSFWGFVRGTFEKMGQRERADAAYYFEKLWQRRCRLSHTARISTRILATLGYPFDLLLLRMPIAYGTSLIRPLMSWFVVITLFGGLYAGFPSLLGRTVNSIWTLSNWVISLHFSVTTFTTLGLGDIYPGRLLGRALTSIEAMVGAVLMALTVVVISRKLMR